jgi:hypothetical protein
VLPILLEQQHGEEAWPCPATRHDMEWRGRLRDLLAVTAGELLAYGLDDLPGTRDYLQRLGYILPASTGAAPPQAGQEQGAGTTTRSRGKWSGNGLTGPCAQRR